ncbi:primosomal protein N' [Corynebacterium sp. 335C]
MTDAPASGTRAPVARVLPLLGLPHLDRVFDYRVPEQMVEAAQPGVRVRVRFGGRLVDGILLELAETTEHPGRLADLKAVVSPHVVYPPQLARLTESLAEYYGGVRSDVIRAAVPSRHARAEKSLAETPPTWEELGPLELDDVDLSSWGAYAYGRSFTAAAVAGDAARPARAAWHPMPGEDVAARLAELAAATAREGGGVLVIVPDQRRLDALEEALRRHVGPRQITALSAGTGPESRYRRYLDALRGSARLVIGTRSAAFTPVRDLRLVVLVDDGDDTLVDPRAPYVHAREVLVTRASQEGCGFLAASWTRTAEMETLVRSGWLAPLMPAPESLAAAVPELRATTDTDDDPADVSRGRLPAAAFRAARAALRDDRPVLVQVPRKGYVPTLSCGSCGAPARCRHCNGPLEIPHAQPADGGPGGGTGQGGPGGPAGPGPRRELPLRAAPGHGGSAGAPTCRWCGRVDARHRCHECGSPRIRAVVTGSDRTAEELGRVFAPHRITASSGEHVVARVDPGARVVVATPGAEPEVEGGYGAAIIMDTWASLGRQDLRAGEEALANWARAAAMVRPAGDGGVVVVDADAALPAVADLLRWDVAAAAAREYADREAAGFPPAVQMAAVDGSAAAVAAFRDGLEAPRGTAFLGPVPLPPGVRPPAGSDADDEPVRLLLRVPRDRARELGRALRVAAARRTSERGSQPVRVIVDPVRIG